MRLNIDEKWKSDPRRTALAKRIGSRAADGMLVEVTWLVLAHKGQPIPLKEFRFIENHKDWIECGLARVDDGEVHVAGANAYSEFFEKQRENGKKGGRPKITQNNPTVTQTKPKKPSFSFSSSLTTTTGGQMSEEEGFGYLADFTGDDETLQHILNPIPGKIQQKWWKKYVPSSVKETLEECRDHYLVKNKTENVEKIQNWNELVSAWIKNEKKTLIARRRR